MSWTNLPTDYMDAEFDGYRKYNQINNTDGTVSFIDVTVYRNRNKSFFGARDANQMNGAINEIMNSTSVAPSMGLSQITLGTSWVAEGEHFKQTVSLPGVAANERIDLQPNATVLAQLMNDGVGALYIENNNGVLTAYAVPNAPSISLTIQVTKFGVPSA